MVRAPLRVGFVPGPQGRCEALLASLSPAFQPSVLAEGSLSLIDTDHAFPELVVVLPGAEGSAPEAGLPSVRLTPEEAELRGEALAAVLWRALDGSRRGPEGRLLGTSPVMARFRGNLLALARSNHPVLLTGENGTGKDLAANVAHLVSSRAEGPFVAVNCGAIPTGLAETEFFGCVRGAFTGAENRTGFCQQALQGTLFLDEVGELPLEIQAKLLRVLENQELRRVGSPRTEATNFRLICATNRDLAEEVRAGKFREDLFYRINVLPLRVPALRERKEDLPVLVRHFLQQETGPRVGCRIASPTWRKLTDYDWPGNLRQLRNVLLRAAVLHGHLPELLPQHVSWD